MLGPLEVRRDGVAVALPGGKPRALLARLLVDAGRVVSVDALADALWGDALPANVAGTIQVYVSNLRRALGPTAIATRAPGYLAAVEGHELDAAVLEERVAAARAHRGAGRAGEALAVARQACALLRGEPLVDVAFEPWASAEVARLAGLALAAHEEVHGALLDLRRHQEALPGLHALVASHPFHERLRAQLMTALYRDGRQAEALRCYGEGRRLLVEELGVEPGPELQQTEARVLAQDEALLAPPPPPPPPAPPPPPSPAPATVDAGPDASLVGRAGPQAVLRRAWQDATAHRLRVVAVEGEPGIGKSALARWAGGLARAGGGVAGFGRCHDLAGSPAYWPWTGALRDLADQVGLDTVATAAGSVTGGGALGALLPELGVDGAPPSTAQFPVFDTCGRVLARLAEAAPVAVVLDDVHWADQASLDLLRFLARMPVRSRVLVVVTHRPVPSDHPLAALRAGLATEPSVVRLPLGPLAPQEVHALVGMLAAAPVPTSVAEDIASRTGGNPFLVRELVKLLRTADGAVDVRRAAVPDTVRDVVRQRAAALGAHALEVLTLASFTTDAFTSALPSGLLGLDRVTVGGVLDEAVRDGLLAEVRGRPGTHRFAHDMVRHALYDAVPKQRRAETHLALGRSLVDLLGDRAEAHAPDLAAHFAQAMDVGGASDAVRWSRAAAAQAVRSLAYADAVGHLRRALLVTRTRLRDDRTECELLVEVAAAARLAADPPTARLAQERAVELADRLGDRALATRAANVLLAPGRHWVTPGG